MERRVWAVYKGGVLKPLEALDLQDEQRVIVTIANRVITGQDVTGYFSPEELAAAVQDDVSIEDVRRALSTISGSLADAVVSLREER